MRKLVLITLLVMMTAIGAWADEASVVNINALTQKAESGTAAAMLLLGNNYFFGKGVQRNEAEGMRWYLKAVELGSAEAAFLAGNGYSVGRGVKKSSTEALKY